MSFVAGDDYAEKVHHSATERHKLQAFCFASEATAEALTGICPRLQTQRVPMGTGIRTVFAYADVEAYAVYAGSWLALYAVSSPDPTIPTHGP